MYKERFENLFKVAQRLTASLNIGDVLETIRDEARSSSPALQEVCLLVIDPDAEHYTRPLHCAVWKERINCRLCKRGRKTIAEALDQGAPALCLIHGDEGRQLSAEEIPPSGFSEVVLPMYQDGQPMAVLDAIAHPGAALREKELVLLRDLAELARNVIENARCYWRISQEKLTLDTVLGHLRPFVPSTVQRIVEKNPAAPDLAKKDADVTILFLDVAGYTRISEDLTREKVNFIIEKYFSSFLDIICSHGGDINETAGDGLMAIFQGPRDETAINATKAAREIKATTSAINEELKGRFPALSVNMGINSGVASVGMSRFSGNSENRMTFTAGGTVTNLAARIAAAAKDGDILLGPETAGRIEARVALVDKGLMSFKNVKDPVRIFSLKQ
jgi:class 3 adenylate cyclase